jgi:hypothetical protein
MHSQVIPQGAGSLRVVTFAGVGNHIEIGKRMSSRVDTRKFIAWAGANC